jgi:toxin ParE1/3/4
MARLVIAATADADTADILDDLATKAGERIAAKYAGLFEKLLVRLTAYPAIGARRPALGQDVRIGIVSPYVVIYDHNANADTVTVLRIVHGRRDISRQMLTSPS